MQIAIKSKICGVMQRRARAHSLTIDLSYCGPAVSSELACMMHNAADFIV